MKSIKIVPKLRLGNRAEQSPKSVSSVDQTSSSPDIPSGRKVKSSKPKELIGKSPRDGISISESQLFVKDNGTPPEDLRLGRGSPCGPTGDRPSTTSSVEDMRRHSPTAVQDGQRKCTKMWQQAKNNAHQGEGAMQGRKEGAKYFTRMNPPKKTASGIDMDDSLSRQMRDIHNDTRKSARIIRDSRARLLEIQKKTTLTEADVKELGERNDLLLREMERFDRLTKTVQKLVGAEGASIRKPREDRRHPDYIPGCMYESAVQHEMKMNHPTVLLATGTGADVPGLVVCDPPTRSKSVRPLSCNKGK